MIFAASALLFVNQISLVYMNSISEIEPKYYADGEDAYAMRRDLTGLKLEVGFCFSVVLRVPTRSFSSSLQTGLHILTFC